MQMSQWEAIFYRLTIELIVLAVVEIDLHGARKEIHNIIFGSFWSHFLKVICLLLAVTTTTVMSLLFLMMGLLTCRMIFFSEFFTKLNVSDLSLFLTLFLDFHVFFILLLYVTISLSCCVAKPHIIIIRHVIFDIFYKF